MAVRPKQKIIIKNKIKSEMQPKKQQETDTYLDVAT